MGPGDIILVAGGEGAELAEVNPGVDVRVTLLDHALTKVPTAVGGLVFARRGATNDWQSGIITGIGPRRVAVRLPSSVEDDRITTRRECLRAFVAEARAWTPGDVWSAVDSGGLWTKSGRHRTYTISRAVRLPMRRCDCDGYVSVLVTPHEFSSVVSDIGALATGHAAGTGSHNSDAAHD